MADREGIFAGDDPFEIFRKWFDAAKAGEPNDPNAMTLATVDDEGMPDLRIVLLKGIDNETLSFFTNYTSRKGQQLLQSGKAAANFHWKSLARQVRFRGTVVRAADNISDAYYASRPLGSRIGAWASQQSQPLAEKNDLRNLVTEYEQRYGDAPPRPSHWGGFVLTPVEIEFWAAGEYRLHDRFRWSRSIGSETWQIRRLNP